MSDSPYSIVIPVCNTNEKCKPLLENLLTSIQMGEYDCPVILALEQDCRGEFTEDIVKKFPFVTPLLSEAPNNLNFCKNSNRGLRYAYEKLNTSCFLVNLDTCLPNRSHLEKTINNGISSPRAQHINGTVEQKVFKLNQASDPFCPCNKGKDTKKVATNKFAFFCAYISKYAMSKIGYLDEKTFVSSFEDDDYAARACLAELPCEQFEIIVHHELENRDPAKGENISTTNSYTLPQLGDHMYRFMAKWKIPGTVQHHEFASWIVKHYVWDDKWKVN